MTNIERITDMEQCFDRVDRALRALEEAVDTITSLEDDILKLDAYYSGDEWKADFRSDELGRRMESRFQIRRIRSPAPGPKTRRSERGCHMGPPRTRRWRQAPHARFRLD